VECVCRHCLTAALNVAMSLLRIVGPGGSVENVYASIECTFFENKIGWQLV
jgi:hypothetical protein